MTFGEKISTAFKDRSLRRRILFVAGALIVFRLLATIPVPGVDSARLASFLAGNQFFGILNIFSGGGLSNLSIIMLGVGPYITGSIIMQVLTILSPKLKALQSEEGDYGRKKFAQYSRVLAVPLAALQGFTLLTLLGRQGVLGVLTPLETATNIVVLVAGAMLLMWIGELISEYGIGNGVSILIFAGIVAGLPQEIGQTLYSYDSGQIPLYILFLAVGLIVIAGVVLVSEAERPIPVTYARQVRGLSTGGSTASYLPIRMNQAGVIPIIFALSILLFPQIIANLFANSSHAWLASTASAMNYFLNNQLLYGAVYFVLVFLFTYFYTAVTFDPNTVATNLQKNGAFVPGIRPGEPTASYLSTVTGRITVFGGLFLGVIAILPLIMKKATGITALALGGTALLIVVSVVMDLIKKLDAQVSLREY